MTLKPAIGVIGGLGPQASAWLYTLLVDKAKDHTDLRDTADYPRVVLLSTAIPNYLQTGQASDPAVMAEVIGLVQEEVRLLEAAGAIVNAIACNTAHLALDQLQSVTAVPFLSIMDLVSGAIAGRARPGLLSTRLTKQTGLYASVHPNLHIPEDSVLEGVETWVFKLLDGSITKADRAAFRQFVDEFKQANDLDAVVLGCTELPVVYGPTARPDVVSTLEVLADGLLDSYYARLCAGQAGDWGQGDEAA
ncbi:MAG: aspartate/glutamate racemase family protein [Bifidobacteriaceae bacterium]|jgi:aspartate racemase|nr:aspartate/glutamate racemase family protein [Bifidobacteriaceae bacterium]